jgi:hypothetical protein
MNREMRGGYVSVSTRGDQSRDSSSCQESYLLIQVIALVVTCAAGQATDAWAQMRSGGAPSFRPAPPGVSDLSPEDIVPLPGTKWLIAGAASKADGGGRTGIALINTANASDVRPLYPSPLATNDWDRRRFRDCPGPPTIELGTHGINVERLADGSYDLMSINHHGRESVEIFHLDQGTPVPRAIWRGCVLMPGAASGNSVAPLPNHAGYVVTNFYQKDDPHYLQSMENGTATGNVLKWTPASDWSPVLPQRFSGANGAETTPDGRWLFVSEWSDYKVWKLSLDNDVPPQSIHLDFLPDNLRLTGRGTILIAGQNADPVNVMTCRTKHLPCQALFTVLEMDPATMETHVLVRGGGAEFGGATGAAIVDGYLWISSYYAGQVARYAPN